MELVKSGVFLKKADVGEAVNRNQLRALNVLRSNARESSESARAKLIKNIGGDVYEKVHDYMVNTVNVTVNIHYILLQKVLIDGVIKNAFEVNAKGEIYGKNRRVWETRCFSNLYNYNIKVNVDNHNVDDPSGDLDRPKYGSVNLFNDLIATNVISYGDVVLTLKPEVKRRCTISSNDTSTACELGVFGYHDHVLNTNLSRLNNLVAYLTKKEKYTTNAPYIEVQIHGKLTLYDVDTAYFSQTKPTVDMTKKLTEYGIKVIEK